MGYCGSDLAVCDCLGSSLCGEINRNDVVEKNLHLLIESLRGFEHSRTL